MTLRKKYELRVDMEDFEGNGTFARYAAFLIESEFDGYKLHVSGFTDGGAGEENFMLGCFGPDVTGPGGPGGPGKEYTHFGGLGNSEFEVGQKIGPHWKSSRSSFLPSSLATRPRT